MIAPANEVVASVDSLYPCRSFQADQLACFLATTSSALPAIVIHGLPATGKSSVLDLVLNSISRPFAIVKSQECVTGRHLLERTLATCLDAVDETLDEKIDRSRYAGCENLSALTVNLQRLLHGLAKFVLVFDKIDRQREAPPTLLPALARLNEFIPNLTVLLVVTSPRQRFLHRVGIPHIHFPSYTRDETLQIISRSPLLIPTDSKASESASEDPDEDTIWLWTRFIAAVYDSQGKSAARDILSMRTLAAKLWQPFVAPIAAGTHGPRDFSKLLLANRSLFQSEEMLTQNIALPAQVPTVHITQPQASSTNDRSRNQSRAQALPYYAKYLLCAAYLASFNPPRTDAVFFMKSSETKKKRRHRRKPAGTGGTTTTTATSASKHRRIPRRLLTPAAVPLERLLAVFHALLPHEIRPTIDVYTQLATLTSLRLLVRAGVGGGGDVLDSSGARWRVNVGWEYVVALGRSVGLEVGEFAFEG